MHPKIIFAKFQTHANVIPSTTLLIILIWRRYPDVETRERNERAWRGRGAVGCHSSAVSFYYLWYGAINDSIYRQALTLSKCVCMRASLENFGIFTFLKMLFLSIFCLYIGNKSRFNFIGGGGGATSTPPSPPPPTSTPVERIVSIKINNIDKKCVYIITEWCILIPYTDYKYTL